MPRDDGIWHLIPSSGSRTHLEVTPGAAWREAPSFVMPELGDAEAHTVYGTCASASVPGDVGLLVTGPSRVDYSDPNSSKQDTNANGDSRLRSVQISCRRAITPLIGAQDEPIKVAASLGISTQILKSVRDRKRPLASWDEGGFRKASGQPADAEIRRLLASLLVLGACYAATGISLFLITVKKWREKGTGYHRGMRKATGAVDA
ncbi:uncharacterized protein EV420DRAFT_1481575 [Desarmillaria tabescens]|uniref:Uncharacterized protein n=1 Tax=Armillaria tabescens TaxID=1929756 RepID=A0AA39N311_ARMTA|nr:uncharacterized protein EV420DRAFT_1481575 [Desarmillaria tabescens]KAK0455345.1 hypothetical protein EV420DRAFT_1481575 [Desarmillaria tabescens]